MKAIAATVFVMLVVAGLFFAWPIWRASNLYHAAISERAMLSACLQAGAVADQWGAIGFDANFSEWKQQESNACASAEIARQSYSSEYR